MGRVLAGIRGAQLLPQCVIRGLQPLLVLAEAEGCRIIFTNQGYIAPGRDLVFHPHAPVSGVDQQAAKAFAQEVPGGPHGGGEYPGGLARSAGVGLDPGNGLFRSLFRAGRVVRVHTGQDNAVHEGLAIPGQGVDLIDVGITPDVLAALDNGVILHFGDDFPPRAFLAVVAVVVHPGLPQHLATITALEFRIRVVPRIFRVGTLQIHLVIEGVGRCTQRDNGPPGVGVVNDLLHLGVGQFTKAGEEHHEIGVGQGIQAGNVVQGGGVDFATFLVDGEEHGTRETVPHGQNLGHLWHALFRAVFLVTGDKDNVLALAGAFLALVGDAFGGCC